MNVDQALLIVDAMVNEVGEGGLDAEVRENYSGRGMYGTTVTSIVLDAERDLIALGYAASEADVPFTDLPKHIDSMGRGLIVY